MWAEVGRLWECVRGKANADQASPRKIGVIHAIVPEEVGCDSIVFSGACMDGELSNVDSSRENAVYTYSDQGKLPAKRRE